LPGSWKKSESRGAKNVFATQQLDHHAKDFTGRVIAFYPAAYAAGALGIFAALSSLAGTGEVRKNFDDFKGLAKARPYSAAAISMFLLSMAGNSTDRWYREQHHFHVVVSSSDH